MKNKNLMMDIGKWVIAILLPFFILISVSRFLLTPMFLQIEYRMPGFPEDSYGLSMDDRLEFAPFALKYLLNSEGIDYLGDLEFDDGTPLYNERELGHMVDVKDVVQVGIKVWFGMTSILVLAIIGARRWDLKDWLKSSFSLGGLITLSLLFLISAIGLLSFNTLFTNFHKIFFEEGSWLFYYSDTLIRLFPIRFWQDVVIAEILLSVIVALGLWLGFKKKDLK